MVKIIAQKKRDSQILKPMKGTQKYVISKIHIKRIQEGWKYSKGK